MQQYFLTFLEIGNVYQRAKSDWAFVLDLSFKMHRACSESINSSHQSLEFFSFFGNKLLYLVNLNISNFNPFILVFCVEKQCRSRTFLLLNLLFGFLFCWLI